MVLKQFCEAKAEYSKDAYLVSK